MADGESRVCVLVQVSGSRPDGRSFGTPQIVLFTLDGVCAASASSAAARPPWPTSGRNPSPAPGSNKSHRNTGMTTRRRAWASPIRKGAQHER
jgi:hypothetical protein